MRRKAFTLTELMITVFILGILLAIAFPKFGDLINRAREGATKGSLGSVRGALMVYYGENEGNFPVDDLDSLRENSKYIPFIPVAKLPGTPHPDRRGVTVFSVGEQLEASDTGGWAYFNDSSEKNYWGMFLVNCTHRNFRDSLLWTEL